MNLFDETGTCTGCGQCTFHIHSERLPSGRFRVTIIGESTSEIKAFVFTIMGQHAMAEARDDEEKAALAPKPVGDIVSEFFGSLNIPPFPESA